MARFTTIILILVLFLLLVPQLGAGLGACETRTVELKDGASPVLQIALEVYTEPVLQELDFVTSEARKNGIGLILCLGNKYKDLGGRPQYVRCPTNLDGDAFYTNPVVNSDFKKQIQTVLTRINTVTGVAYRDDPAIMGWELISLQPHGGQVDHHFGKLISSRWIQDMASFVKSIDGNHLLTVGVEHLYGDSNMLQKKEIDFIDFIRNHLFIKEIDFITIHRYADVWLKSGDADGKRMYGGGKTFEHFPDMHRVLQRSDKVSSSQGVLAPTITGGCVTHEGGSTTLQAFRLH